MHTLFAKIILFFTLSIGLLPLTVAARTATINNATHGYLAVSPNSKSAPECTNPRSYQCTLEFNDFLDNVIIIHGVGTNGHLTYSRKTRKITLQGEIIEFMQMCFVYGNKTIMVAKPGRYYITQYLPKGGFTVTYTIK